MATEPAKAPRQPSQAVLRAWGQALVKTGTEHLDLGMVRQGKKRLQEAEAITAPDAPWETLSREQKQTELRAHYKRNQASLEAYAKQIIKWAIEDGDPAGHRLGIQILKNAMEMDIPAAPRETLPSEPIQTGLSAYGQALIKTGTEDGDLNMVQLGKRILKDAEDITATAAPRKT